MAQVPPIPRIASTTVRTPRNDDTMQGLLIENALLQRRNLYLTQQDIKLRAALELATGVPWDSEDLAGLHDETLEEVLARNYAHGHHISMAEAHRIVKENRHMASPTQVKKPLEEKPLQQ